MDSSSVAMAADNESFLAGIIGTIIGFGAIAFIILFVLGLFWYILQAIGFYKMSKNRGIEPAWVAWIPVCQNYLFGELIGNKVWGFGYANWILVIIPIVTGFINGFAGIVNQFLAFVFLIVVIAFYAYMMTALYKLYQEYSDHPVLFLVLSIVFPFLSSCFIFAIRNNVPKELP